MFFKTYNTEFDETIVIFMDQNGKPLKIEDNVNLTLVINKYMPLYSLEPRTRDLC